MAIWRDLPAVPWRRRQGARWDRLWPNQEEAVVDQGHEVVGQPPAISEQPPEPPPTGRPEVRCALLAGHVDGRHAWALFVTPPGSDLCGKTGTSLELARQHLVPSLQWTVDVAACESCRKSVDKLGEYCGWHENQMEERQAASEWEQRARDSRQELDGIRAALGLHPTEPHESVLHEIGLYRQGDRDIREALGLGPDDGDATVLGRARALREHENRWGPVCDALNLPHTAELGEAVEKIEHMANTVPWRTSWCTPRCRCTG